MATDSPAATVKEISCRIVSVAAPSLAVAPFPPPAPPSPWASGTVFPKPCTSTTLAVVFVMPEFALSLRRLLATLALLFVVASAARAAEPPTVLIFGDSLSAGYGIALEQSWPALLEKRLATQTRPWRLVNASISGETTAGGRSRLEAVLTQTKPRVLVLALGANDGLRGLPVAQMRANLKAMIDMAQAQKLRVLLVGMRLPPNYGPAYNQAFEAVFAELAKSHKLALLPFLLAPVAADAEAFQADRLHPVAAVQPRLLDHVWPALKPLLK